MQRLILNDGTIIENGDAGYASGTLCLWIPGTIADVAAICTNPAKMSRVTLQTDYETETYEGYTDCRSLSVNDGVVSVCMAKGA